MTYPQHIRGVLTLGLPLIGSHIAQYGITLTDAVMLGWYDVDALAAEVLGGMLFFVLFIAGSGFAWAVMPMVASAEGKGDQQNVRRVTRMGIWVSLLFAFACVPVFLWSRDVFAVLGQEAHTSDLAAQYLRIAGMGIVPALMVMVLKSYLAALERTKVVLWITLVAVVANVVINYALIFGNWGMPEMGIRGAAIASLIVQVISFGLVAAYVIVATPEHGVFSRFWRPDWEAFGQVFRLGWPIGITNLAEVGLFAASSVMMGWLGTVALAAHGIALQIASLTFMVHLGLGNVATVRAGRAVGRGDPVALRRGGIVVVAMSMLFGLVAVGVFLAIPEVLIGVFLDPEDPQRGAVLTIGVSLMAAAALFQIMDAAQVMALGLLRGVQDTRVPMVIAAVSYWGIGIPVSYWLGFVRDMGGVGVWLGLAIGLACAGVMLMLRFWRWSVHRAFAAE